MNNLALALYDAAVTLLTRPWLEGMTEAVIEVLTAAGVPRDRCIMNF